MVQAQEWLNANIPNINHRNQAINLQIYQTSGTNDSTNLSFYNSLLEGELDLSDFANLETLRIQGQGVDEQARHKLTRLKIENCPKIKNLQINYTDLNNLNLEHNTALETLNCNYNKLADLNLENNPKVQTLNCQFNQLTSLKLARNSDLVNLNCDSENVELTALDLINCSKLTNVRKNTTTNFYTGHIETLENRINDSEKQKEQVQSQVNRLVALITTENKLDASLLKELKEEVKKIKIEDSTYQLTSKRSELEKAINSIKSKLNEDTQDWLDTLLEMKRELITSKNSSIFNKQFKRAKKNLLRSITEEEVKYPLDKLEEVIKLEKKLKGLQGPNYEVFEATPKAIPIGP